MLSRQEMGEGSPPREAPGGLVLTVKSRPMQAMEIFKAKT